MTQRNGVLVRDFGVLVKKTVTSASLGGKRGKSVIFVDNRFESGTKALTINGDAGKIIGQRLLSPVSPAREILITGERAVVVARRHEQLVSRHGVTLLHSGLPDVVRTETTYRYCRVRSARISPRPDGNASSALPITVPGRALLPRGRIA
jgi:hypothetical protein